MPAMTRPTPEGLALLEELADDLAAAGVPFERPPLNRFGTTPG